MASKPASLLPAMLRPLRASAVPRFATSPLRQSSRLLQASPSSSPIFARAAHSIPKPPGVTPRDTAGTSQSSPKSEGERPEVPQGREAAYYQLSFTCVPCGHRSHHNISKQGYHTGSTLITCPECRNRHIISDHLGILTDKRGITIEDIMREKGQLVKRGSLGEDGDIEFWPDDTQDSGKTGGQ